MLPQLAVGKGGHRAVALAFGIEQGIQRQHRCLAAQPQGHPVRSVVQTEICLHGLSQLRPVHRFVEVLDRADGVAVLEWHSWLLAMKRMLVCSFSARGSRASSIPVRPPSGYPYIIRSSNRSPPSSAAASSPALDQGRDGVLRLKPGENPAAQVADLLLGITLILTGRHSVYISRPLAASWLHYRWGIPVCRGQAESASLFDGPFLVYAVQFLSFHCLYLCSVGQIQNFIFIFYKFLLISKICIKSKSPKAFPQRRSLLFAKNIRKAGFI